MMIIQDNQGAIAIAKNHKVSQRTKHIDIRAYFIRDVLQQDLATQHYCATTDQLADMPTKPSEKMCINDSELTCLALVKSCVLY